MRGNGRGFNKSEKYACPITAKLMKKGKFFLAHETELGLSEEQVDQIKAIKLDTKKAAARQKAEHEIFMLDMESKLSETAVDVDGISRMIDEQIPMMTQGAKKTVEDFAKLKAVLTPEQLAKAKELWKAKDSD